MPRKKNPDIEYKICIHNNRGYTYAASIENTISEKTKKKYKRYIHWGVVDRELVFYPNLLFLSLPKETRNKFIFPSGWSISYENKDICNLPIVKRPSLLDEKAQYNNRLYGHIWLLLEISKKIGLTTDLIDIFENNINIVNELMTLGIYACVGNQSFNHVNSWQLVVKTPTEKNLTPHYITRLTQYISDNHRMLLIKARLIRQPNKGLVACDSTTRSAWGHCLADIHWGYNKDNPTLKNTVEVVVYSISTHEPLYYRSFAGNISDYITLRTIQADLNSFNINKFTFIFDRGYQSLENIDRLIIDNISFLMCTKVYERFIYDTIKEIKFDSTGLPCNMEYDEDLQIYYIQFKELYTVNTLYENKEKLNVVIIKDIYLDINRRFECLRQINKDISEEENEIEKIKLEKSKDFKKMKYYRVKISNHEINIIRNNDRIEKEKDCCGFFSMVSYKMFGTAIDHYYSYKLRDEQEKYFDIMKNQMGFDIQRNSSESGKNGRLFILFIGLILKSKLRYTWKSRLHDIYPTSIDILNEMRSIRMCEYNDGSSHITTFSGRQLDICDAFDINPPLECVTKRNKNKKIQ